MTIYVVRLQFIDQHWDAAFYTDERAAKMHAAWLQTNREQFLAFGSFAVDLYCVQVRDRFESAL